MFGFKKKWIPIYIPRISFIGHKRIVKLEKVGKINKITGELKKIEYGFGESYSRTFSKEENDAFIEKFFGGAENISQEDSGVILNPFTHECIGAVEYLMDENGKPNEYFDKVLDSISNRAHAFGSKRPVSDDPFEIHRVV